MLWKWQSVDVGMFIPGQDPKKELFSTPFISIIPVPVAERPAVANPTSFELSNSLVKALVT